jgi:hypothetical protein
MRFLCSLRCAVRLPGEEERVLAWSASFPTVTEALESHAKEIERKLSEFPALASPGGVRFLSVIAFEPIPQPVEFDMPLLETRLVDSWPDNFQRRRPRRANRRGA